MSISLDTNQSADDSPKQCEVAWLRCAVRERVSATHEDGECNDSLVGRLPSVVRDRGQANSLTILNAQEA